MSDLAATNCGCGCDCNSGGNGCNIICGVINICGALNDRHNTGLAVLGSVARMQAFCLDFCGAFNLFHY